MENILTQKFSYAEITPYKNYSQIKERKRLNTTFNVDLDKLDDGDESKNDNIDPFNDQTYAEHVVKNKYNESVGITMRFEEKEGKKSTKYFYNDKPIGERLQINYAYKNKQTGFNYIETTKDRHIKSHYGNPFSAITIRLIERSVRRHGNKITIKVYKQVKRRDINWLYFVTNMSVKSITIDLTSGNFVITELLNNGKLKQTQFRKNSFNTLKNILFTNTNLFNTSQDKYLSKKSPVYDDFRKKFNDFDFLISTKRALGLNHEEDYFGYDADSIYSNFIHIFTQLKKIKTPNEYIDLIAKHYPTEKLLKKNERKLIASILDMYGIKSKITIKLLHLYPKLNIPALVYLCKLLGDDYHKYLGNLNLNVFQKNITSSYEDRNFKNNIFNGIQTYNNIQTSDVEKENIVRILNTLSCLTLSGQSNDESFISIRILEHFVDHFDMIKKIKPYNPTIHLKARTLIEFNEEHREFSKIISAIRKGWVLEYTFSDKMVAAIEEPILSLYVDENEQENVITLYPHLLKREDEYQEEGAHMHHCVASYSDKERSVIISLRNEAGDMRVTSEFNTQDGRCIQSRSYCNANPPVQFHHGLLVLKERAELYARLGLLHSIEKRKVPVLINGKPIIADEMKQIRGGENMVYNAQVVVPFRREEDENPFFDF